MCVCDSVQLSRQHQLLEQENSAVTDEDKKLRHELRKFRDGLVVRKEVRSTVVDELSVLLVVSMSP